MTLGDRITAAYHSMWEKVAEMTGHPVERADGVALVSTGSPIGFLNRAFVQQDPANPATALDRAHEFFGDLPFFFEIRRDEFPRAAEEAARRQLAVAMSTPGMVLDAADAVALDVGPGALEIRTVSSGDDLATNLRLQADAFGMPVEMIEPVFGALMAEPGTRTLTGWCEGEPVATSVVVAHDGLAGIYSVATVEAARGRGFGEAMTAAAVRAGVEELGCTESYLQSSAMGKGLYDRMGYRTITTYDAFACNA